MTKYDKVIKIFQESFQFGLNAVQEMGFIALVADDPSIVDQFSLYRRPIFLS